MPCITVDEQFQFLLSCIRYANGGKINFDEVAKECDLVSKGAAAKRYERLMKAHNINFNAITGKSPRHGQPGSSLPGSAGPSSPSKTATTADLGATKTPKSGASSKKRKMKDTTNDKKSKKAKLTASVKDEIEKRKDDDTITRPTTPNIEAGEAIVVEDAFYYSNGEE